MEIPIPPHLANNEGAKVIWPVLKMLVLQGNGQALRLLADLCLGRIKTGQIGMSLAFYRKLLNAAMGRR